MGGVQKQHEKYYVVPLKTKSYMFDNIDLMKGTIVDNTFDFAADKKLHILRTYSRYTNTKRKPFGTFTHNFSKTINPKISYTKESIASKIKNSPKDACEFGWHDIAGDIYLGKLKDLDAVFDEKTNLCNVYDDYGNLKTTLLIKNKKTKLPIGDTLKLLQKPDGTEVLFVKDENATWSNLQGASMNFTETELGYEITLDNGEKEIYDFSGKLIEIDKGDLVISLAYRGGKLIRVSDNHAHELKFKYKKSLLRKIVNYDGTTIKYRYNDKKQLNRVIYEDGRKIGYNYDDDGRLSEVYKNGVLSNSYIYDSEGRVEQTSGIKGHNLKYFSYDANGISVEENGENIDYTFVLNHSQAKLDTVKSDEGMAVYGYDDNGHQISFTDKLGVTRVTLYDKNGLLKEDIDKAGTGQESVTKTQYDANLRKPTVIKTPRKVTYNVYDNKGQTAYKVDTLVDDNGYALQNKIDHKVYNDKGLVVKTETGTNKSQIKYDAHGNAIEVTNQLGLTQKVTEYNQADLPLVSVDSDAEVTKTTYNKTNKPIKETVDGRTTATMQYDAQGRLSKRTSSDGVTSYFKYDDAGNIVESGDSTGEKNIYTFDTQNNLMKTQRYQNGTLVYLNKKTYNKMHKVLSETDAYGDTTTYTYNQQGQKVQKTDANGHSTYYEYNDIGKLARETDALGGVTSYDYDEAGHRTRIETPNGAVFEYSYDGFGRLTSELNPDKGLTEYTYDSEDRLLTVTNSNGYSKTNHYDNKGRLVEMSYDDSSLNVHYTYSDKSELIKMSDASGSTSFVSDKDKLLKKTHRIDGHDFVISHTYTPENKVKTTTYPSGKTISYSYNGKGEISSVVVDGNTYINHVHLHNGKIIGYDYADGTSHTRVYDMADRAMMLSYPNYQEKVSYDALSNITSMQTDKAQYAFAYDDIERVTDFDVNNTTKQQFGYDENGNRLSLVTSNDTKNYYYTVGSNILNQIKSDKQADIEYVYDDMGNIVNDGTHTYSYDGRNRLIGVDDAIKYQYNYANQRVSKTVDGVTTYFVYDGHKLLGEYDAEGKMLREYLYLNDTPIAMITPTQTYRIYADHLDTPRRVANENGAILWQWDFTPYGEKKATGSLVFNLRFPGQYYDAETEHHYNINRDYDPVTGRYTQSDPVGFKGGVNTYAYAEANPVMKKDAMGLWASAYFWKVHQYLNRRVFGNTWKKRIFDDATVAVDRHQRPEQSYLHAMRDGRHHESIGQARARANHHVRTGFGVARTYINRGDGRHAYNTLGWVLHTLQDSTSPAHKYFQPWYGSPVGSWAWWQHVRQEKSTSQLNSAAYRATRYVWHMFYYRLVPNTNVFIF